MKDYIANTVFAFRSMPPPSLHGRLLRMVAPFSTFCTREQSDIDVWRNYTLHAASAHTVDMAVEQSFGDMISLPGFPEVLSPPGFLRAGPEK